MEAVLPVVISSVVALLTTLLTLAVGFLIGKQRARDADLSTMKLAAYADFMRGSARVSCARRIGRSVDDLDELMQLNDAKARVLLSADTKVADALARFWRNGGTLEVESGIIAFRQLCDEMRRSLGLKPLPLDIELSDLLFQLLPSSYSHAASRSGTTAE